MAAGITVELRDHVSPALGKELGVGLPSAMARVAGEDLTIEVQDHLRRLDSERANKLGGKRTHFFGEAAANTTHSVAGDTVTVSVNKQGMRQRFHGGVIKAQNKKWLTIPARAEAYGRTAREFNNLRFVMLGGDTAALVEADATRVAFSKDKNWSGAEAVDETGGMVMFWLKRSVTQMPDPSVLPTAQRLGAVAALSARDYVASLGGER